MGAARPIAWSLVLAGLASLAYAGIRGDLEVYLLVVIPIVAGTGPWAALGLLATVGGLAGLLWTSATRRLGPRSPPPPGAGPAAERVDEHSAGEAEHRREAKGGGVILLGPIPIAWGSDRSTVTWLVVAGILLTVAAVALTLFARP